MFRDARGELWELTLDLVACRRVRDLTRVNLLSLDTARIFAALADPLALAGILYAACQPQADARGVSEEDFLRRLSVNLDEIVDAFVERLADFFQRLGRGASATQLRTALTRARELARLTTTEELTRLTEETFDWMVARIQRRASGPAATNSPDSVESAPISPA